MGSDAAAQIAAAQPYYDFTSASLEPWHLKATYQFYDSNGNPTEQGKWEYWWASPKVHRESWTRGGLSRNEWSTADGRLFRMDRGGSLRYFERRLESTLLSPLPASSVPGEDSLRLELKMVEAGGAQLARVSIQPQRLAGGHPAEPNSAEEYFFDRPTHALRMKYSNQLTTGYNQIARMQGRYLARQVEVLAGKQRIFSITVESVEWMDAADSALTPDPEATDVTARTADQPEEAGPGAESPVKKTAPVYPLMAQASRTQGTVILAAVIGKDGKIHDMEVLAAPSPLLAGSAENAVKTWEYKPPVLNGVPVESEAVVDVTFGLSQ